MNFGESLQNVERSIVHIKLRWSEIPVSTVDELKKHCLFLVCKLSIHEEFEFLKHVEYLKVQPCKLYL